MSTELLERPTIDPEYDRHDEATRPFAVEQGYAQWGDWSGHIVSVESEKMSEQRRQGNLAYNDTSEVLGHSWRVALSASEIGYFSRDIHKEVRVDNKFGHQLVDMVLSDQQEHETSWAERERDRLHEVLSRRSDLHEDIRLYYMDRIKALGAVSCFLPDVARQSYLWGRTGSKYFLHAADPDTVSLQFLGITIPATVTHHDGLITTDVTLEEKQLAEIDNTLLKFAAADVPEPTREELREMRRQVRRHARMGIKNFDAKWVRERIIATRMADQERERLRQESRMNPRPVS